MERALIQIVTYAAAIVVSTSMLLEKGNTHLQCISWLMDLNSGSDFEDTVQQLDNRASVQWNPFVRNSFKMKLELVLKTEEWMDNRESVQWNPFIRNSFKMKLELVLKTQ